MIQELKKIMLTQGVSSREENVKNVIADIIKPYVDEIKTDALGNLIAVKKSGKKDAKKIMFCAHMDEIGFLVNYIDKNGLIRITRVGGINFTAAAYSKVVFENGVTGIIVPEANTEAKDFTQDKFYVDIGCKTKRETEKKVKIGDTCALQSTFTKLYGNRYAGRPFDDRIGCYILTEVAKTIKKCDNDVYFVFSTQEEVGTRGSRTASFNVMPDIGIAVDVTPAGDVCKADSNLSVKLGGGAAIKFKDNSVMCDRQLVSSLIEEAEKNNIKYQREVLIYGGTDTSSMQTAGLGARAGCISVPVRFCHTQNEMIDMKDVDECIKLACKAAEIKL